MLFVTQMAMFFTLLYLYMTQRECWQQEMGQGVTRGSFAGSQFCGEDKESWHPSEWFKVSFRPSF